MAQSRRWVFTLNNPTDDEEQLVHDFCEKQVYAVVGNERGESGTRHYQGFIIFENAKRLSWLRNHFTPRAHYEAARGNSKQASDYCKKDGDFEEYGEFPGKQGKRTDIDDYIDWVKSLTCPPSEREVATRFPALFLRYKRSLMELAIHHVPEPNICEGDLNEWQLDLDELLRGEPDDRFINFYVDEDGGKGKSYFIRWFLSNYPGTCQKLSVGKRDDIAHAIDATKRVFFFDIPRGGMEFMQYNVLEMLKDQMVFSPKYDSTTKIIRHKVHVVVFSNEDPDMSALSEDRYRLRRL